MPTWGQLARPSLDYSSALWEAGDAEARGITSGPYAKYSWVMEYQSLGASRVDVQDQGGLRVRPTAPGVVRIFSSNGADAAGGTGARAVMVRGLGVGSVSGVSAPWKTETVPMNGTGDAFTVGTFLDVQDITVVDSGVTDSNEGTIDAFIGSDHQLQIALDPSVVGNGVSKSGHMFIPQGWYGTADSTHVGWTGNNDLSLWFGIRPLGATSLIWPLSKKLATSQEVSAPGLTFPPGAHVCVQGQRAGGGSVVPVDINLTIALTRL